MVETQDTRLYSVRLDRNQRQFNEFAPRLVSELFSSLGEVSIVFPSTSYYDAELNMTTFGKFIAEKLYGQMIAARQEGKIVFLDLATGSTPKAVWPELRRLMQEGEFDASQGVIIGGHEEVYGDPVRNGQGVDYEGNRELTARDVFGLEIKEITDPSQIGQSGSPIDGNFVPMHLEKAERSEEMSDEDFFKAEREAAERSAVRYREIVHKLAAREDVVVLSLYGVGTDGHIAEIQPNMLTGAVPVDLTTVYAYPHTANSYASGMFPWDGVNTRPNQMYEAVPGANLLAGVTTEGYHGARQLIGVGWDEMLLADDLILAFNDGTKAGAFELTLRGSVDGLIESGTGTEIMQIVRETGEGDGIYNDLLIYAQSLEEDGFLDDRTIADIRNGEGNKCRALFRAIYTKLFEVQAPISDSYFRDIYRKMWEFANRYVGKQAPVAVLVRLRTLLGLNTTIVATPEVVQGTRYEILLQREEVK